jgi:nucleoside-triphosphatase THEP1
LHKIKNSISDKWLKASILGSLWASIEILLGSFLHNMKIPFTGTILSSIAIILIVSFIKKWNQPGIIIRSTLICAIMKSISPSAVILGPMIGIIMEGFLFESSIAIFGRNIFGFMFGGILAVLSPIIQSVCVFIIMYGTNIIEIFYKTANSITKGIGFTNFNPNTLLLFIIGINIVIGIIAVILGIYLGGKTTNSQNYEESFRKIIDEQKQTFDFASNRKYSIIHLVFHVISIITILICQTVLNFLYSSLLILIYSLFCIYQYRFLFFRFKNNKIWLEFSLIIILSSMILGGISNLNNVLFGLMIGVQMILRAVIIILGFSIIGYELRNPLIINWFINILGRQFYLSLDLAFLTLPSMTGILIKQKKIFKNPVQSYIELFTAVNEIMDNLKHTIRTVNPKVIIISGGVNSGKTTLLNSLVEELRNRNFKIAGLITENFYDGSEKSGFDIIDVSSHEKRILCRKNGINSDIKAGNFFFSEDGIKFGESALKNIETDKCDLIILDEIGNLELRGQGWSNSIDNLLMTSGIQMIFVVRDNLVNKVCRRWNIQPMAICNASKDNINEIIRKISVI